MATINIKDLRLRTIIGIYDWEREHKQDVIINITIEYDASKAIYSDDINDTVDYKVITKRIIKEVEDSNYYLVEKLADQVLNISLDNPLAKQATVTVDKPHALRFADSVSVTLSKTKS